VGIVAFIIAIILIGAIINTSQNTSALRKNIYLLFKERFSFYLSIGDTERKTVPLSETEIKRRSAHD
jgi:hypothetical protein